MQFIYGNIAQIWHIGSELQKAGSTGSAEPNFLRFSAKFVQFSAKFLSLNMQIGNNLKIPSSQPVNGANYINTM